MKLDFRIPVAETEDEVHVHLIGPPKKIEEEKGRLPAVIFSHGFTVCGFESHRLFIKIGERLASNGFISILFDYRGSGYSDRHFEEITFSDMISDLRSVYKYFTKYEKVDSNKIGVIGQSLGSSVAICALKDVKVRAFVLMGVEFNMYETFEKWLGIEKIKRIYQDGKICLDKGYYLTREFLEDIKRYDLVACIKEIKAPVLIIQAEKDTITPVHEARKLYEYVHEPKNFIIMKGANHSYKCQLDLEDELILHIIKWFQKHLMTP